MAVQITTSSFDYLSTPTASNIRPNIGDITICGWHKTAATPGSQPFFSINDGSTFFSIAINPTGYYAIESGPGTTRLQADSFGVLSGGTWYFLAITRTSGTYEIFIGDESTAIASDGTVAGWAGGNEWPTSGARLAFFGERGSDTSTPDTEMAYWRIWQSALTSGEIEAERASATSVKAGVWAEYVFASEATKSTALVGTNLSETGGTYVDGTDPTLPSAGPTLIPRSMLLGAG